MALRELAIWAAMGATGAAPVGVVASTPGTYDVLGAYAQAVAAAPCPVDARDLAAIQSVESPSAVVDETGMVSNPDGSPVRGDGGQSYGPFQFYTAAGTWTTYGNGGNPDRLPDAAAATARMLCANNYATDRHAAIARHNGSGPAAQAYADRVIKAADGAPPIAAGQSSSSDCQPGSGRSIGVVVGRAWCNLVVRPWLAIGSRNPGNEAWDKVDHAVFGDAPSSTPAAVAPSSLPNGEGLQPDFARRLGQMFAAAPGAVTITSGFRTTAEQVAIIESHGGECGYMVACVTNGVCGSDHCRGLAVDLSFENAATDEWVHANANRFGINQCMSWEPWHFSPSTVCPNTK